jgi:N-acetylmuramoyl-L-alanine amidase
VDEESTVSIKTTSAVKDKAKVKKEELKEEPEAKNKWNIELTEDEIELLAKIVWVESRGESSKGQRGVVEVVLNRMKHWAFKGSLEDVLSASGQFASWKLRNNAKPTKKEYKNIKKVLNGETDITSLNTVYFSTKSRNNKLLVHIGGHYFNEYEYESKEDRNKK